MRCIHCGRELSANAGLVCPYCGKEIQIVPDYNPLEDVLTEQVKGAVSETLRININQEQLDKYIEKKESRRDTGRTSAGKAYQRTTNTDSLLYTSERSEGDNIRMEREKRKLRAERKREQARKKRQRLIFASIATVVALSGLSIFSYVNSYEGKVRSGYKALSALEYTEAESYFQKAISRKERRPEAYAGLAEVYVAQGKLEKAEKLFLKAIKKQPENVSLYEAIVHFYVESEQEVKVMQLLGPCKDKRVLDALHEFVSKGPAFSLEEKEVYDEVQALELTSTGKEIYYTTDGSEPTISSTKYTEPIKLVEGENVISAISVNEKNIPSLPVKKVYTVEFPIEDAPSVTPSTGRYEANQKIKVVVPEGYVAYYTMDGTNPTTSESRIKYSGPFDMPEGNTVLSVVLMNQKEKYSDITKRTYELELQNE